MRIGRPECFCGEDEVDDETVEAAVVSEALDDVDEKELEDTDLTDDVDDVKDDESEDNENAYVEDP